MPTATLSSKSQLVLPAQVRRQLGIKAGDRLLIDVEQDRIIIKKAFKSYVDTLESLASPIWQGFERELDEERNRWEN